MDPPTGSGSGEAGSEHSCNLDKPRPGQCAFPAQQSPMQVGMEIASWWGSEVYARGRD